MKSILTVLIVVLMITMATGCDKAYREVTKISHDLVVGTDLSMSEDLTERVRRLSG